MSENLTEHWTLLVEKLNLQFNADLDLHGILFLIGVQEMGAGQRALSKEQKMDMMHIATCRVLVKYGYYELENVDEDGWPHYKTRKKLPRLTPGQQTDLLKQAVLDYFRERDPS